MRAIALSLLIAGFCLAATIDGLIDLAGNPIITIGYAIVGACASVFALGYAERLGLAR